MAKTRTTAFFCSACGYESAKWMGQCPSCRQWNTFVEETMTTGSKTLPSQGQGSAGAKNEPVALTKIQAREDDRIKTEIEGSGESFWDSTMNRYSMFHKTADGQLTEKTLLLKHIRKDGSTALLTIDEASSGFRRMLDLVILLMNNDRMKNTTVVIDEIEQSLHTVISKNLIEALKENSIENDCKSQLVFITHDTNLLDLDLLRRDEIQFMEKDRVSGESHITNFAEFKIVPGLNVEKGYLEGRFGAIPLLHHNLNWRKNGKKNS